MELEVLQRIEKRLAVIESRLETLVDLERECAKVSSRMDLVEKRCEPLLQMDSHLILMA